MRIEKKFRVVLREEELPWDMTPEEAEIADTDIEDMIGDDPAPSTCPNCGSGVDVTDNNIAYCTGADCETASFNKNDNLYTTVVSKKPISRGIDPRSPSTSEDPYHGVFSGAKDPRFIETIKRIRKNMGLID